MMRGQHPVERPVLPPLLEQGIARAPGRGLQIAGDRCGRPQQGVRDARAARTGSPRRRLRPRSPGEGHGRRSPLRPDPETMRSPAAAGPGCRGRPRRPRPAVPVRRRPGLRDPAGTVRYARAMAAGRASCPSSAPARMTETAWSIRRLAARGRLARASVRACGSALADEVAHVRIDLLELAIDAAGLAAAIEPGQRLAEDNRGCPRPARRADCPDNWRGRCAPRSRACCRRDRRGPGGCASSSSSGCPDSGSPPPRAPAAPRRTGACSTADSRHYRLPGRRSAGAAAAPARASSAALPAAGSAGSAGRDWRPRRVGWPVAAAGCSSRVDVGPGGRVAGGPSDLRAGGCGCPGPRPGRSACAAAIRARRPARPDWRARPRSGPGSGGGWTRCPISGAHELRTAVREDDALHGAHFLLESGRPVDRPVRLRCASAGMAVPARRIRPRRWLRMTFPHIPNVPGYNIEGYLSPALSDGNY